MEDRSSEVEFEDCGQCADVSGSGICANCEKDGNYCEACHTTGRCPFCQGTGRRRRETDPALAEEVRAHGPLIVPESERPS